MTLLHRLVADLYQACAAAALASLSDTDNFYRLVDTYRMLTAGELMQAALERGLGPLYAELRHLEDADSECLAHPRLKARDDATALRARVGRV